MILAEQGLCPDLIGVCENTNPTANDVASSLLFGDVFLSFSGAQTLRSLIICTHLF